MSIFTLDGNYVGKIGTPGSNRGQLCSSSSVIVDLYGHIESCNNCVSIFLTKMVSVGSWIIHCFGSSGSIVIVNFHLLVEQVLMVVFLSVTTITNVYEAK